MGVAPFQNEAHLKVGGLLKEAVFGFNDGLVSTFAVIAGLSGGNVDQPTVLLAALATLFAGAFSMGLGTYLGSKSEKEHYESERAREIYEMDHMPEVEKQEIREIYAAKGFSGDLLEKVVEKIVSDRDVWLATMMTDELGFAGEPPKPGLNGLTMSGAFIAGSLVACSPYFFKLPGSMTFLIALGTSIAGLLVAGGLKTKFTGKNAVLSALETLGVGTLAAGGSYGIGILFS